MHVSTRLWMVEGRTMQDAWLAEINRQKIGGIVDTDIQDFFDNLDRDWLLKLIQYLISVKRILRLVERILKAGVEEDGV
jgi:RNA-directed DNA polymerase